MTTHNECNAEHRRRRREVAVEAMDEVPDQASDQDDIIEAMTDEGLRAKIRTVFASLDERCRKLLELLIQVPPLPYAEVAERAGMPHGSLGPTRARCLDKLRRRLAGEV